MVVLNCLKVENGIIALADSKECNALNKKEIEVTITLTEYGFLIKIGEIEIPIPEALID